MNTTIRNTLAALALLGTGSIAGPMIVDAQSTPAPVSSNLALAGANSTFVPIVAYRAMDTRESPKLDADGFPFDSPTNLLRFFADLEDGGDGLVKIPAEAVAVSFTITAVQTEGRGFLSIGPSNLSTATTSVVNWTMDDQQVANSGNVLLGLANEDGNGSDSLDVMIGGDPGAKTHVLVDITGYYLPIAP